MNTDSTPSSQGFRAPAEWESQEAVWLSWPFNLKTWPNHFAPIPKKFAEIAAVISRFQKVRINCPRSLQDEPRRLLAKAGAELSRIEFYDHPTNDAWCRDHGPIFIKNDRTGEVALTDWQYNAWGGKYPPYDLDNQVPGRIAEALSMRRFEIPIVMEGGSIEVDGAGQLLTTEACLLNRNRNPHLTRREIEVQLCDNLGVDRILWLHDGIVGDDTDGHIDDLARFYRTDAIVTLYEDNEKDPNFPILHENWERLKDLRTRDGRGFELKRLPMPSPVLCDGERLPASYANYLVINGAVLLPVFDQSGPDELAAEVMSDCFPGREIIPMDCVDLVLGLGALHCISQQQPS